MKRMCLTFLATALLTACGSSPLRDGSTLEDLKPVAIPAAGTQSAPSVAPEKLIEHYRAALEVETDPAARTRISQRLADLGQHPEGDDDLQICVQRPQAFQKAGVLEFLRLQYRQSAGGGIFLYRAFGELHATAGRLVQRRYHSYDVEPGFHDSIQAGYGKLRRAHKHYPGELITRHRSNIFS